MFSKSAIFGYFKKKSVKRRARNTLAYLLNLIIIVNSVGAVFIPSIGIAQSLTPEEQARIDAINKAQWDGALSVQLTNIASQRFGKLWTTSKDSWI